MSLVSSPSRMHLRIAPRAIRPGDGRGVVGGKLAIVLVIALGHVGIVSLLTLQPVRVRLVGPAPAPITAGLFEPAVDEPTISLQTFEASDIGPEVPAPLLPLDAIHEALTEAPRIDPDVALSTTPYVSRAQLLPGEVVVVLLMLHIAADGSVMSAEVIRSNGSDAANAAAIDYARATRWIPGTLDGEPAPMQASLTVILGET